MDERKLRDFFTGRLSGRRLGKNIRGSVAYSDKVTRIVYTREMKESFVVSRTMAVALCDAVLNGELPAKYLEWIGFTLATSERFDWNEDDLLTNVFECWSSTQINWPLTIENVRRFRRWLTAEELYPQEPTAQGNYQKSATELVSVTKKAPTSFPKLRARLRALFGAALES